MCQHNPRMCKDAPNNQLAHEIRTAIMRWPAQRKALQELHGKVLSDLVKDDPGRRDEALDSARAFGNQLRELDAMMRTIEAALALHAEQEIQS